MVTVVKVCFQNNVMNSASSGKAKDYLTITDTTLDVVFSSFRCISFTITLRQKLKGATSMLSLCMFFQCSMRVTPSGFCLRVVANEKSFNLEKTTSSVLSVMVNTLWVNHIPATGGLGKTQQTLVYELATMKSKKILYSFK